MYQRETEGVGTKQPVVEEGQLSVGVLWLGVCPSRFSEATIIFFGQFQYSACGHSTTHGCFTSSASFIFSLVPNFFLVLVLFPVYTGFYALEKIFVFFFVLSQGSIITHKAPYHPIPTQPSFSIHIIQYYSISHLGDFLLFLFLLPPWLLNRRHTLQGTIWPA